jgi:pimeloyl-ACP methyl ester carboxylesterase
LPDAGILEEVVVVGWSIGGHIALEMTQSFPGAKANRSPALALILVGAPLVGQGTFLQAFRPEACGRLPKSITLDAQHSATHSRRT